MLPALELLVLLRPLYPSSTGRTTGISLPWAQDNWDFAAQTCLSLQIGTRQEPARVSTKAIRMSYFGEHFWVSKTHTYFGGGFWKGWRGL